MEPQEIFDKVARHLLTQNIKSREGTKCVYRCPDGRQCAGGPLIKDEEWTPEINSTAWYDLPQQIVERVGHADLVATLQNIHDGFDPRDWPARLRRVARDHKLDATIVDQVLKELGRDDHLGA